MFGGCCDAEGGRRLLPQRLRGFSWRGGSDGAIVLSGTPSVGGGIGGGEV